MPLTDAKIRALKPADKQQKISDGGGLHLLLTPQGSKLWRMAYRYNRRQKTLAFGAYPTVSLSEARQKRDAAKRLLAAGSDPGQQAKIEKAEARTSNTNTFGAIAEELMTKRTKDGLAETTLGKKRWLLSLVTPDLGKRPVKEITAAEILESLRKVEAKGNYETARRLRAIVGEVFRYAIATARAENDPTFGLQGALIAPQVEHQPAITDWTGFSGLIRAIWGYQGAPETRAALKLLALLYTRPGELRHAEWCEFDLEKAVWTIPAPKTKMRRDHRKPLSPRAIEVLVELKEFTRHGRLVFPSISSPGRPISENTLNGALRRMGFTGDEMTSHGFRASASSLLNESGRWNPDAIEAELGHVGADEVRRAYHRAAYWDERVKMAEWWAKRIEGALTA